MMWICKKTAISQMRAKADIMAKNAIDNKFQKSKNV